MENSLFETLAEVLKQDDRFVSHEWDLLKNTIRDKAESLDENLISLLLDNELLRAKFFVSIKDVIVFDAHKFIKLINNKEFLPDSFTSFKNKIGLTSRQGDFIASSNEVVLSFPFKDCVLAGGQDKEDSKRDEVFYNEILGSDDIDRLFDKKVFTNFKRIDKDGEHNLKGFNRNEEWTITDNLIIKGNNLLALHSLKSNFAWKVKLIYIDPPYNTGNDGFKYNDKFNHSTWLTFMKNRLEVAKELLKEDGVIFVSIDDSEQAYLKVLMDSIFWRHNFISNIIWEKKFSPQNDARYLSDNHDFIVIYAKNKEWWDINLLPRTDEMNARYSNLDNDPRWDWTSWALQVKTYSEAYDYPITTPSWRTVHAWNGSCWRFSKEKLKEMISDNRIWFGYDWNSVPRLKRFLSEVQDGVVPLTIWRHTEVWHNQSAKQWLWKLDLNFSSPKPEMLLERIIHISTSPWDLVLDYHLWSWTTCAVAHKMGRQYIGIEQMDYIETVSIERMKKVIEWEQGGISKNVEWKWGGECVYMEIMQANQRIIDEINQASNISDLLKIYEQIKESEFINYSVDTGTLDLSNLDENDFDALKAFLMEILDKNLLYVNYSERNDRNSWVSEEDKKVNEGFYNL